MKKSCPASRTDLIESSSAPEAEVAADEVGVVAAAAAVAELDLQDPELVERVLHLEKSFSRLGL